MHILLNRPKIDGLTGKCVQFYLILESTMSEQSDVELKISALQEQLNERKLEASRLRSLQKQLRRDRSCLFDFLVQISLLGSFHHLVNSQYI